MKGNFRFYSLTINLQALYLLFHVGALHRASQAKGDHLPGAR